VVLIAELTSWFSSCPAGPHRLATVDEPGWRALSASLDAEVSVPIGDSRLYYA
jgi:hypothetical protein